VVKHNKKNNIRTTQTLILNGSTYPDKFLELSISYMEILTMITLI